MEKKNRFPAFILFSLVAVLAVVSFLKGNGGIPLLEPTGWVGLQQRDLIVKVSSIMMLIVIPVVFLTIYFGWKYREGNEKSKYEPEWDNNHWVEAVWWGVPFLIIVVFAFWTWTSSHALDPYKPLDSERKALKIQVVALNWKWLFIYPEQKIATVNWIQFPEKTPLEFEITADAPMNSFWLPDLGGQIYAMAGMKTKLYLIADQQGVFRGCSANISGDGFAGMIFTAQSTSQEGFEAWVDSVRSSAASLDQREYEQLSQPSSYNQPAFYALSQENLFDQIVMKYMSPMGKR